MEACATRISVGRLDASGNLSAGAESEPDVLGRFGILGPVFSLNFCRGLGLGVVLGGVAWAALPVNYAGKPFQDAFHRGGMPSVPGLIQCALYDLGGEGVAYHDTDALNNGSGKLNQEAGHQRAHGGTYIWNFRRDEGVDLSFVKDWADLNHTNQVTPPLNQFYIGWTENGEWCNYTVNVTRPGRYRIKALYAFQTNTVTFDLNGQSASTCRLPEATPGYHHWNLAEIGFITLPETGPQLLTFHYGKGNNFGWFDFEWVGEAGK